MTIEVMSNGVELDFGNYKQFKLPEIVKPLEKYGVQIKSEHLAIENLDNVAMRRIESGEDFFITNAMSTAKDKNKTKTIDGIYSPKYGVTQFDDKLGTRDMYRCQCGEVKGAIELGTICPTCNTEVEFIDVDLAKTGWIPLGKYAIINPAIFKFLEKFIGKGELNEILKVDVTKMTGNGILEGDKSGKFPFHHIGLDIFRHKFDEVMEFYLKKAPRKKNLYEFIMKRRDVVFTSHIPVYSAILRPKIENNEKIKSFKANTIYDTIMQQYEIINSEMNNMTAIIPALLEIQMEYMELYDWLIDSYTGKKGSFRSQFGGIRVDYGSRAVIINGKDLRPEEVDIPYVVGVVFLELELVFLLRELDGITESEAYTILNQALRKFNPRLHALMNSILTKAKTPMHMLVNRP